MSNVKICKQCVFSLQYNKSENVYCTMEYDNGYPRKVGEYYGPRPWEKKYNIPDKKVVTMQFKIPEDCLYRLEQIIDTRQSR